MNQTLVLAALVLFGAPAAQAHGDRHGPTTYPAEQKAWGIVGKAAAAKRTITVDMTDGMRFTPDSITVREGETVRFVVRNRGRMLHEMVIGSPDELREHAALMARFPDMQHDEPYMVHVEPGKSGEILWHFNRPGSFEFACLIPGHYEAGMRGTIAVIPR